MYTTLTLSSQGQIVIPSKVRKMIGVKPGDKLHLRVQKRRDTSVITIEPQTKSWVNRVTGVARGIYGNVDDYIRRERGLWD